MAPRRRRTQSRASRRARPTGPPRSASAPVPESPRARSRRCRRPPRPSRWRRPAWRPGPRPCPSLPRRPSRRAARRLAGAGRSPARRPGSRPRPRSRCRAPRARRRGGSGRAACAGRGQAGASRGRGLRGGVRLGGGRAAAGAELGPIPELGAACRALHDGLPSSEVCAAPSIRARAPRVSRASRFGRQNGRFGRAWAPERFTPVTRLRRADGGRETRAWRARSKLVSLFSASAARAVDSPWNQRRGVP